MVLGTLLCSSATCCIQNSSEMRANKNLCQFSDLWRNFVLSTGIAATFTYISDFWRMKLPANQQLSRCFYLLLTRWLTLCMIQKSWTQAVWYFHWRQTQNSGLVAKSCLHSAMLGACHLLSRWWVNSALLPKEEAGSSSAPLEGTKVRWRHALFHITYYTAGGVSSGVTGVMLAEKEESGGKNIHWTALKLLFWFVEVS